MSRHPKPLLPQSPERPQTTRSLYGRRARYLLLGDQLDTLFAGLSWDDLDRFGPTPPSQLFILAMVTIFQCVEGLTDLQSVDALRQRLDWKYALHLPLDYPGFPVHQLADFRARLLRDATGLRIFQQMVDRIARLDLLDEAGELSTDAVGILTIIDTLNCVEEVYVAMHRALEALASSDADALRAIVLPHWYQRYALQPDARTIPQTHEERQRLLQTLKEDVSSFLAATVACDGFEGAEWPEVQALQQLWQRRFSRGGYDMTKPECDTGTTAVTNL